MVWTTLEAFIERDKTMALKIYTYEIGWPGTLIVTAETKEEAFEKMIPILTPHDDDISIDYVVEHELEGFSHLG